MRAIITIQFTKSSIFYCLSKKISITETNIPSCLHDFRSDVYWDIEILKYNSENHVHAKVISYDGRMQRFANQLSIGFDISKIIFVGIDFREVIKAIASNISKNLTVEKKSIQVKVPFVNLTYNDGSVQFSTNIHEFFVDIKIYNNFIRKEFEPISNYIAKAIGVKNVTFLIEYLMIVDKDGDIKAVQIEKASAREIDQINSSILENATCDFSLDLILGGNRLENPHDLRTPEQFLKEILGDDQDISPEVFLEKAFIFKGGKHRNQLKYLSSKHLSDIFSLHFTPDPFSFLFLIPGRDKYFLVLETFDVELATYMWECDPSPDSAQNKLEEIKPLMTAFSERYRQKYYSSKPVGFHRIQHNYKNDIDGYNVWRERFDAIIA